ncbi:MAG: metal ABC transporter substrate-binding protein [Spirochaetota bacterium]
MLRVFITFLFTSAFVSMLSAKVSVVTTTTDLEYIAKKIGKNRVKVKSLIRGFDDPHFVMARPDFIINMSKADVFVMIGLDLEVGWAPLLLEKSRNMKIQKGQPGYCDASVGIKILGQPTINVDRSMGDMHIYGNPHYWNDPINAIQMANNIRNALMRVDPTHSEEYNNNYKQFRKDIIRVTKQELRKFKPYFGARVAVFHDQFVYLSTRFKFKANLTIEERPGVPPSNRYMEQTINYMKSNNIKVILVGIYQNLKYAKYVSSKVPGSKVLVMPVSVGGTKQATTYEKTLQIMLTKIRKALKETGYKRR